MFHSNRDPNKNNQSDANLVNDLIQNKSPEIVIAALLLSGKLKFDSVQLFREASLIVSLVGTFNKNDSDRVDQMVEFLDDNGDMTIDEIFKALKKKVQD